MFKENFMKNISESSLGNKNQKLYKMFIDAIDEIDDSLNVKDFAEVVSHILVNDYGSHNYKEFMNVLKKKGVK